MSDHVAVRPARSEDAIPVTTLLRELGLNMPASEPDARQFWQNLWHANPFYHHFPGAVQYGWVLEAAPGIVGFFGSIPRIYEINGKKVPVSVASRWGVRKEFRTFVPMLCDAYFQQNPIDLKLVTTAIKPTGRIFERYGGLPVPGRDLGKVQMVPLDLSALAKLRRGRFLSNVGATLAGLVPWKHQFRAIRPDEGFTEILGDNYPADLDDFFTTHASLEESLIATRNVEILKWQYDTWKTDRWKAQFVYRAAGRITGFAVLTIEPVPGHSQITRFKVMDLVALNAYTKRKMIRQLVRVAFRAGGHVLEIHLPGMVDPTVLPRITLTRNLPQYPLYFHSSDPAMASYLQHTDHWRISPFDGDSSLG